MKVAVLAAGKGTRLQPLTLTTPKPLLKVAGRCLLDYLLERLSSARLTDVLINAHHLSAELQDYVGDGGRWGLSVSWFVEPALMDTGGALLNMLPSIGDQPCIVISADIWTEYPLKRLIDVAHRVRGMHLMMVPNPSFNPEGDFSFEPPELTHGRLQERVVTPSYNYGGYAVVHPSLIRAQQEAKFPLKRLMDLALKQQACTGDVWQGQWFNVGTPEELQQLDLMLKERV